MLSMDGNNTNQLSKLRKIYHNHIQICVRQTNQQNNVTRSRRNYDCILHSKLLTVRSACLNDTELPVRIS